MASQDTPSQTSSRYPTGQPSTSVTDEGYSEQRFELAEHMKNWTDDEKGEYAYQLLLSIPTPKSRLIVDRLSPLLHRDYISRLPSELGVLIAGFLDIQTLVQLQRVSRHWLGLTRDQAMWRTLFMRQGWTYNEAAMSSYLANDPTPSQQQQQQHLQQLNVRHNDAYTSRSQLSRGRITPLPLARTTAPRYDPRRLPTMPGAPPPTSSNPTRRRRPRFLPFRRNRDSEASRPPSPPLQASSSSTTSTSGSVSESEDVMESILTDHAHDGDDSSSGGSDMDTSSDHGELTTTTTTATTATTATATSTTTMKRRVIERASQRPMGGDETGQFHYSEEEDRRFINWRRLYENRHAIEKRWQTGNYWLRSFPSADAQGELQGHTDWVYCLQFDANTLVSGSRDCHLKIWDIATGTCTHTLFGHSASVLCLQFNDDWIFSGSSDRSVLVWDRQNGCMIRHRLAGHTGPVLNLCFHEGRLVTASKDRTVRVWEDVRLLHDHELQTKQILTGHEAAINSVKVHADTVVSASGDRTIRVWNAVTGQCLKVLSGHSRGIACVELIGKYIVSGSGDQTIVIWDLEKGEMLHTLAGHTDLVRTLQMDAHQRFIVSGGYDGTLRIWDAINGQQQRSIQRGIDGRILNLHFDFTKIACGTNLSRIFVVDFSHGIDTIFLV